MDNGSKFCKDLKKDKERSLKYYADCVKCEKCGRSILIGKKDKVLCPSCGRYLFKDKKTEFMYRMGKLMWNVI